MAEKKAPDRHQEDKKGGHGAAHGGAWKVAYADFVTAMMSFFLVMWLMGADEETKSSIANYFNNPTLAWRPELKDNDTRYRWVTKRARVKTFSRALMGRSPINWSKSPLRSFRRTRRPKSMPTSSTSEEIAAADTLSFSFDEKELFPQEESAEIAKERASRLFEKIGKVARNFGGTLVVRGAFDETASGNYELEMSRLVAVQHYIIEKRWLGEDLMSTSLRKRPTPSDDERRPASAIRRKIELVFMK